jgi:hypothetical protein
MFDHLRRRMAALCCVAVCAPAPLWAAQMNEAGALRRDHMASDAAAPMPEMGVTQLPSRGRTELPETPVTPRTRYARPPAHLP